MPHDSVYCGQSSIVFLENCEIHAQHDYTDFGKTVPDKALFFSAENY